MKYVSVSMFERPYLEKTLQKKSGSRCRLAQVLQKKKKEGEEEEDKKNMSLT
jgi:hypothetical protein